MRERRQDRASLRHDPLSQICITNSGLTEKGLADLCLHLVSRQLQLSSPGIYVDGFDDRRSPPDDIA